MKINIRNHILRKIVGVIFIVLGVLALVTPFTPGSWLVFVGFGLLGFKLMFKDGKICLKKNNCKE